MNIHLDCCPSFETRFALLRMRTFAHTLILRSDPKDRVSKDGHAHILSAFVFFRAVPGEVR